MTAQTGRTAFKWVRFDVDDTGGTLRTLPINTLSIVGLTYDEQDVTAWADAVKTYLPTMPDCPIEIGGPVDNSARAAAATLSGSHTVLNNLPGKLTPLTLCIKFGIRHAWEADEPIFGLAASTTDGFLCTRYTVDPSNMTYSARFVLNAGSGIAAWGTTDIT